MWNIGQALIKGNGDGPYRTVYLARLACEHHKAIDEGLIPASTMKKTIASWEERGLPALELVATINPNEHRSAGHIANRAQRCMEQRLLRDLWQAWRRATERMPERARAHLPAAIYKKAA